MKKINVLMCCSDLSVKGGMVSVVKNYLSYENWDNINIIYVPTHIEKGKIYKTIFFLCAYVKILVLAMRGKIDIAHLHTAERGSFFRKAIILHTLKRFGIKTLLHHHGAEFELFYDGLSSRKKKFVDRTLEKADVNVVLSKRLVSMITSKAANAKVRVLYNAVPTHKTNLYNSDATGILFLGRMGKRKGTYDLLDALKQIDDNIAPSIKYYFCGDGEIDEIKLKIKEYSLEYRIAHIGWIDGEKKNEIFENTLINILPSYNEGLPMTILETMAYGIPNISTNIASIPEVIHDSKNGYMIEPGSIDVLADRIATLIKSPELRNQFSNESYKEIKERFSLFVHVQMLGEMYKEMLGENYEM